MADLAWSLLRRGYDAVDRDRRARRAGDDYVSRLLGRRAVVLRSPAGVRAFYDETLTERTGAVPPPLALVLFGPGAVHGLDGVEHRDRKRLMLDTLSPAGLEPVVDAARVELAASLSRRGERPVRLFDELVTVYGAAALLGLGVRAPDDQVRRLARTMAAMVDGFGVATPAYPRAVVARLRADRWARDVVRRARAGEPVLAPDSPLQHLVGSDLDDRTAGVELLNVVRPSVAVAWLGTFAGLRLARHPELRPALAEDADARRSFVQEVRRTTPFAPVLAGRARVGRRIGGVEVRAGDHLVLDVVGVDHDPERWPRPATFEPGRFLDVSPGAHDLVPQGGGLPSGHRCPGESLTARLLDVTVEQLAAVELDLASERVDRRRIPTLPTGGPVLRGR